MNKQVKLLKANFEDLQMIWKMQVEAFSELYEKYHDTETSPATEKIDKIIPELFMHILNCICKWLCMIRQLQSCQPV